MKNTYFYYLKLNMKMKMTWIIPVIFFLVLIISIFTVPLIIPTKPESFYLLFVDSDMNTLLMFYITLFAIVFGIVKTYNLFLSKKLENKNNFKAKFFTLSTFSFIFSFITWLILTIFLFSTKHYKSIQNYVLLDASYFLIPFIGTIFISMIFLFFNCLLTKKFITIPILTVILIFFAGWAPTVSQRSYSGHSKKDYESYWIDDNTRIDYYEKFDGNKIYFVPYYVTTSTTSKTETINLLNKNAELTNLLVQSIENNKKDILIKQIQTYLLPTIYMTNSMVLDLNLKYIYDNYDEKKLSSDIGFDNLNNIVQNQSVIETLNYYKEVHYANEADSIKVSSTDMINEIKNRISPSKTNNLLVETTTSENYFYFELKNKITPQWSTYILLIAETLIFSYLSYYLVDKNKRLN